MRLKQILHIEPKNKEELINLLRDAHVRALIDDETLAMIEGVMQFSQMRVRDIMLPKKQMTCIAKSDSLEKIIITVTDSGHSRFPVTGDTQDEIVGILHAKDLLRITLHATADFALGDIVRKATFVPESKR